MAAYLDVGVLQSTPGEDIGALQSTGIVILSESVSDSITFSDAIQLGYGIIVPDTITFSDFVTINPPEVGYLIQDNWSIYLSDTQQYELDLFIPLTDTIPFSDFIQLSIGLILNDSLSLSDSQATAVGIPVSVSDTIVLTDAVLTYILGVYSESINDTITFSDAVTIFLIGLLFKDIVNSSNSHDTFVFTDEVALRTTGTPASFTDTLSLSDGVSLVVNINLNINDSITFSDTIAETKTPTALTVSISDTISFGEDLFFELKGQLIQIVDVMSWTDSIDINLGQDNNSYLRRYLNDVI